MARMVTDAQIAAARSVPIEDEIARRGITLKGKIEREGPCPICGGTDRFSINTKKQVFNCRGCTNGGDVIALVQHLDGCGFQDAVRMLTGTCDEQRDPFASMKARAKSNGNGPNINGSSQASVIVAEFVYLQADGTPFMKVVKFCPKDFKQQHWNGLTWKWGGPTGNIIPYRFTELLKASGVVFVVEGEKDADRLVSLGLTATTNPGGAGKWPPEFSQWFDEWQTVYIIEDNDAPGRRHAQDVARSLSGVVASVRIVRLPGLPEKGDVSDWLDAGGDRDGLLKLCGEASEWVPGDGSNGEDERQQEFMSDDPGPFPASDFTGQSPDRTWIVKDWIAEGVVNSLYGQGGVGKTLLAQQLAYCLATSKPFLGIPVEKKKVLCVLCEDDRDEIHRRHDCIKAGLGVVIGNPFNDVWLWPRVGYDNLLVTWDSSNQPTISKQFQSILDQVLEKRLDFLILDTLADMYGGNEIIRAQVNHFLKTVLGRLILEARANGFTLTVLLLAHPSTAGLNTGTGLSGSTAWENAVRARLYLRLPENGSSDERELVRVKANYSTYGEDTVIRLLWHEGIFIKTTVDSESVQIKSAKKYIIELVSSAFRRKQGYTQRKGHRRHIYTKCVKDAEGLGVIKSVALQAIRELIDDGEISPGKDRKGNRGYRISDDGNDDGGDGTHDGT